MLRLHDALERGLVDQLGHDVCMASDQGTVRRPGMAPLVADALRRRIRSGALSPGQRLVEAEIMLEQDVTRGAVRGAFDLLAGEGLVERVPNKGARVRMVSTDEAIQILECRRVLEGLIARDAALRVDQENAGRLRLVLGELRDAAEAHDLPRYSELDQRLHQAIADASNQSTAAELIHRLRSQIVRHQFRLALRADRTAKSLADHEALVDAILTKDPHRAERVALDHVAATIAALREM